MGPRASDYLQVLRTAKHSQKLADIILSIDTRNEGRDTLLTQPRQAVKTCIATLNHTWWAKTAAFPEPAHSPAQPNPHLHLSKKMCLHHSLNRNVVSHLLVLGLLQTEPPAHQRLAGTDECKMVLLCCYDLCYRFYLQNKIFPACEEADLWNKITFNNPLKWRSYQEGVKVTIDMLDFLFFFFFRRGYKKKCKFCKLRTI